MVEEENIYIIPLRKTVLKIPKWERSKAAMKEIRRFIARHNHTEEDKVFLSRSINQKIWEKGAERPPSAIRVRTIRSEDGEVDAELVAD
ncbi:MAG TPA: 50S ribosomal protein L31e [Halobacteria archaeon]|jgi:large subunit ribosomal protein L31e|nr:50S ribosomal protein L31e [Halobacteria archaeon]HIH78617.1 50S ribosomal protein L31e [Halobacteria archaeon]